MQPRKITNKTGTIGAPVDWDAEKYGECQGLDVVMTQENGLLCIRSAWQPSPEEIAQLVLGQPVVLTVFGATHPVVSIGVVAASMPVPQETATNEPS